MFHIFPRSVWVFISVLIRQYAIRKAFIPVLIFFRCDFCIPAASSPTTAVGSAAFWASRYKWKWHGTQHTGVAPSPPGIMPAAVKYQFICSRVFHAEGCALLSMLVDAHRIPGDSWYLVSDPVHYQLPTGVLLSWCSISRGILLFIPGYVRIIDEFSCLCY